MTLERDDEIAALLPWYLNGTLEDAERQRVEAWLRAAPEREAELAMWRAVQASARESLPAPAFDELAWRRLRAQLPDARRMTWMKAAVAASVLVIAGLQTAILLRDGAEVHRPLSEAPATDQWRLQVRFDESATMQQIGELLDRHQAQLLSGPSALGLYTIGVAKDSQPAIEPLLEALRKEPSIFEVTASP